MWAGSAMPEMSNAAQPAVFDSGKLQSAPSHCVYVATRDADVMGGKAADRDEVGCYFRIGVGRVSGGYPDALEGPRW